MPSNKLVKKKPELHAGKSSERAEASEKQARGQQAATPVDGMQFRLFLENTMRLFLN